MKEKQICKICDIEKPIYDFGKKGKFKYRLECKECWNKKKREFNKLSEKEKIKLKEESKLREEEKKIELYKRKNENEIKKENKKKLKYEKLVSEYNKRMEGKIEKRNIKLKNYMCNECGNSEVNNFYPKRKNRCKSCILSNSNKYYQYDKMNDEEKKIYIEKQRDWVSKNIIKVRVSAAKNRSIRKNIPFEINDEIITKKFQEQQGKCFISKQILSFKENDWYSLSLDRLDSNLGYTIENTILVTKFVNTSKNALVYDEYIKLLKEVCDNI